MIANALRLVETHPFFTFALVAALTLSVCVAVFAAKRRPAKGAVVLALLAGVVAWWCLAYFLEITMPTPGLKLLAVRCAYVAITSLPVLWLLLAARSTDIVDLSRPWRIALAASVPGLTLAFAFAYPHSRLLWTGVRLDTSLVHPMLVFSQGPWFWVNVAWSYALLLVGFGAVPRLAEGRAALLPGADRGADRGDGRALDPARAHDVRGAGAARFQHRPRSSWR